MNPTLFDDMDPSESAGKARRRRRLSSIGVAVPSTSTNNSPHAFDDVGELHHHAETHAITPRKKKKQVRFSEPGPDVISSASTGLTPAIRRQSLLSSTPSLLREPPKRLRRRKSMPTRLSPAEAPSPTKTLQFAPLRQVLDGRVTRRLRRNHLSEEINTIAKEKKDQARRRKLEVELLKQEIDDKNRALEDLENELHMTRQLANETGIGPGHDGELTPEETMQALKKEVARLKEEITKQEEHSNKTPSKGDFTIMSSIDRDDDDDLMHMSIDDFDANMTDVRDASPCRSWASSAASPDTTRQLVTTATQTAPDADLSSQLATLQSALQSLAAKNEYLQTTCQRAATKLSPFIPSTTSASDDDDATTLDAALDTVLTTLALSQSDTIAARSALTTLSTAVTSLGFPGDSPASMLATMQSQYREARLALERLQPGETVQAFDNPTLLSLLLTRLQTLYPTLAALRDKDATTTTRIDSAKKEQYAAERRAIHAEQAQTALSAQHRAASATAATLTAEVKEKEHAILRLQGALDGYRREVASLETLVTRLEEEHAAATTTQRRAADEAVADLHATHAETAALAAQRLALLQTLETKLASAQATAEQVQEQSTTLLAQKEALIRHLSSEVDSKAYLVTARNTQIQQLGEEVETLRDGLAAANTEVNTLTGTNGMLEGVLEREREESQTAIREVQEEVMRAISRLASTRGCLGPCEDEQGAREGDAGGWLPETPTSMRFGSSSAVGSSPVRREGKKEVRFGGVTGMKRKRWDSGIGVDSEFEVLEEEEEEEGEDAQGGERLDEVVNGGEVSSPVEV